MNEKLDLILNEIEKVNSKLDHHEELLVQLIKIVEATNNKIDVLNEEFTDSRK